MLLNVKEGLSSRTMYTLADKSRFQAKAIAQGRHSLAVEQQRIMDWIRKQYDVHALDFYCETRDTSKGVRQQLVHVILNTAEDVKRMQARGSSPEVLERFLKYFTSVESSNPISDPLKRNVFPAETDPFPEIIVTYRPLKELTLEILEQMLDDEKRAILKTIECVWTISQTVIFYYTEAQVKENLANDISKRIIAQLRHVDGKYGSKRSASYTFDSKEVFDRDYESNWYYYWK
jgi:hypothetical protein